MKLTQIPVLLCAVMLAACNGNDVSDTLGLNKEAPDEFVVVSRPPLVVPPEFDLKPPTPGAEPPHIQSTEAQARQVLLGGTAAGAAAIAADPTVADKPGFGSESAVPSLDEFMNQSADAPKVETAVDPVVSSDPLSSSAANFLKQAGADSANENIRKELGEAKPPVKDTADSLYEELVSDPSQEPTVDPGKESERLRSNKDAGKPVTEGDTPTHDDTPKSVIDKVF